MTGTFAVFGVRNYRRYALGLAASAVGAGTVISVVAGLLNTFDSVGRHAFVQDVVPA